MHAEQEPLVRPLPGRDLLTEAECDLRDAEIEARRPFATLRDEYFAHSALSMQIFLNRPAV